MSTEENKALVHRFYDEVWQNNNLDAMDEILATDVNNYTLPPDIPGGIEGSKAFAGMFASAFPNTTMNIEDVLADGDKVIVRWSATAKHEGELMGVPASGKDVNVHGIGIYRIAEGKITDIWGEFDMLGMMQQIGSAPAAN